MVNTTGTAEVTSSVEFHGYFFSRAIKVKDVSTHTHLPPEFPSI